MKSFPFPILHFSTNSSYHTFKGNYFQSVTMPAGFPSHEVEEVSLWGLVQTQTQSQGWHTPLFISYIILQVTHMQSRPDDVNLLVIPIVKPADTRKDFRPISAISYHLHCPTDGVTVTTPEAFASLTYFSCFRRDFTPLNVIYTDELADRTCLLTHNQITTKSPRWHVPLVHHPAYSSGWKRNFFCFTCYWQSMKGRKKNFKSSEDI